MVDAKQTKVVEIARSKIGSTNYGLWCYNQSFTPTEPKCNLFVADCLKGAGVLFPMQEIKAPGRYKLFSLTFNDSTLYRPPTASQWADPTFASDKYKYVGKGQEGLQKCWPGDIISDGGHVGIISGVRKVISASSKENKVVENDWGWRQGECNNVIIRRYHP